MAPNPEVSLEKQLTTFNTEGIVLTFEKSDAFKQYNVVFMHQLLSRLRLLSTVSAIKRIYAAICRPHHVFYHELVGLGGAAGYTTNTERQSRVFVG
jgi:hypothetical protein